MRNVTLASGLFLLSLAACGQGREDRAADGKVGTAGTPPAAETPTGPTPGLWRVSTRMTGMPDGMKPPVVETCIHEAKFEPPTGATTQSGMTCDQQTFRREDDAMVGHMVCTSPDGVRTVTDTRVTGDFSRNYTMQVTSKMTPAPDPSMAEVSMVMTAERLGDCPAEAPAG